MILLSTSKLLEIIYTSVDNPVDNRLDVQRDLGIPGCLLVLNSIYKRTNRIVKPNFSGQWEYREAHPQLTWLATFFITTSIILLPDSVSLCLMKGRGSRALLQ